MGKLVTIYIKVLKYWLKLNTCKRLLYCIFKEYGSTDVRSYGPFKFYFFDEFQVIKLDLIFFFSCNVKVYSKFVFESVGIANLFELHILIRDLVNLSACSLI